MAKTTPGRNRNQKCKEKYQKAREEAQLYGMIPTEPQGALKSERVDPSGQEEPGLPHLVASAVRNGWATPDEVKPKIVDKLVEPFTMEAEIRMDREGNQIEVPPDRYLLKENAKVLAMLDRQQWERDHPEEAGKTKGGTNVSVSQEMNIGVTATELTDLLKRAEEQRKTCDT